MSDPLRVAVLPLADGSILVLAVKAPHRVVRRPEPFVFGGDPMREVRALSAISDGLEKAREELLEELDTLASPDVDRLASSLAKKLPFLAPEVIEEKLREYLRSAFACGQGVA